MLDHQQNDRHITDGGIVPDSQPATEGARLERLKQIEASIALMDRLFWDGLDDIKNA
jgi:hypothetical protein